jgi:hypothetical protein
MCPPLEYTTLLLFNLYILEGCFARWDSSFSKVSGYRLDDRVWFLTGAGILLFSITSRQTVGPIHPLIHWVLEIKWLKHEADCCPPSRARLKDFWSFTSMSVICLHGWYMYLYSVCNL